MNKPYEVRLVEHLYSKKHVVLKGDHPHAGKHGIVRGAEMARAIGQWGMVVDLENGESCFVFHQKHWSVVEGMKG